MKLLLLLLLTLSPLWLNAQQEIQYFKSFDKTRIAYTDEGKGEAVILIHGFISSGTSWNKTVLKKSLLDQGYRVIVPDLRGNGNSDKPQKSRAYARDAEVRDLKKLADHLSLKSYTAIGYSRGSIVLAKLLTKDNRIKKAVLGGMGLDFTNPNWPRRVLFADAFSGRAALTEETEGAVNYAKSIGADIKILGYLQDHQPVTAVSDLNKVEIKVLVIAGGDDHDNGSPVELKEAFPNSELVIIPGDHNNTYKQKNFSEAIMSFMKNL